MDTPLTTVDEVARALGVESFAPEETPRVEYLILQAGDLVRAYCRGLPDTPPAAVGRVVAAMVARVLRADDAGIPEGASNMSATMGPFSQQVGFNNQGGGFTSVTPWLTAGDRRVLGRWRGGKAFTITMG